MYLEIIYRNPGALLPMTIGCPNAKFPVPEEKGSIYYNLKISDKKIVNDFYENYKKLRHDPNGKTYFDTKAQVYFYVENRVDTLCMNNFGQTLLNGVPQKDNAELFAVIQDTISQNYHKFKRGKTSN
ncbi:hypothetical protein [Flavobacterium sp.]